MTPTHALFSTAAVAAMAACFLITALACAAAVARRHPATTARRVSSTGWIDGLRGLAASLVVMNHVPLIVADHLRLGPTLEPEAVRFANHLGVIGVQVFFCITGHLFASRILGSRNVDWTDFFVRRIRRLVPAYAVAVLVALVVGAVALRAGPSYWIAALTNLPHLMAFGIFPLPMIEGFDMHRLLGVNWTLAIEWRFYAVLPLLFAMRRFGHMNGPVSLLAFTLLLVTLLGTGIWLYFIVGAATTFLPQAKPAGRLRKPLVLVAMGILASMALNWDALASHKIAQGAHVAILFSTLCLLRPRWLGTGAVTAMGTLSYSFYLLHLPVLFVVFGLCHRFLFDITRLPPAAFALMGIAGVAASVLAAALSHARVERRFMALRTSPANAPLSPVFTREALRSPGPGDRRHRPRATLWIDTSHGRLQ